MSFVCPAPRRSAFWTAICLLASAAVAPAFAAKSSSKAEAKADALEHRQAGLSALSHQDEAKAISELELARSLDPADAVVQFELGKIRFKQNLMAEAINRFEDAARLQPKDAPTWYNLGYACRKAGRYDRAIEAYHECLSISADEPDAIYGLAESLRLAGKGAAAVAVYREYVDKEKRPSEAKWVKVAQGRIIELDGAAQQAATARAAALKAAETAAGSDRKKAPALIVPLPATASSLGATAVGAGAAAAAGATAPTSSGAAPPPPAGAAPPPPAAETAARLAAGDAASANKDYRTALRNYQDAAQGDPRSAAALIKVAGTESKLGYDSTAIDHYSAALAIEPANQAAKDGLAEAREREARRLAPAENHAITASVAPAVGAAVSPLSTGTGAVAASGTPGYSSMTAVPAAAATATGSTPGASGGATRTALPPPAAAMANNTAVDEEGARQRYSAGVELIGQRQFPKAVAALDQALLLKPGYAYALIARGSAKIALGQYAAATNDYAAAHKAAPDLAAPLFGLAEAFRALGQNKKAADLYREFAASGAPDAADNLKVYAIQNARTLDGQ